MPRVGRPVHIERAASQSLTGGGQLSAGAFADGSGRQLPAENYSLRGGGGVPFHRQAPLRRRRTHSNQHRDGSGDSPLS